MSHTGACAVYSHFAIHIPIFLGVKLYSLKVIYELQS